MKFLRGIICFVLFLSVLCNQQCIANTGSFPEHEVKAAFIFNFMRFTEWPPERVDDPNESMNIFVIGNYTKCKTLKEMNKKKINEKEVNAHIFKSFKDIQDPNVLKTSHVLFISSSDKKHIKQILEIVKDYNVLAISDTKDFLEMGGIINFVKKGQKIRFEVNGAVADDEKLLISSKLLKLATRVIVKEPEK